MEFYNNLIKIITFILHIFYVCIKIYSICTILNYVILHNYVLLKYMIICLLFGNFLLISIQFYPCPNGHK